MRIAYLTADRGIPLFGAEGAAVHIREFVGAIAALGNDVSLLAARRGGPNGSLPAKIIEFSVAEVPSAANSPTDKRRAWERRSLATAEVAVEYLLALHIETPFDLIYERYSLWSAAGCRAAVHLGIPCIVEVNSPLLQEQRKYRKLVLTDRAEAIESEVFTTAHAIVTVSSEVRDYVVTRGADPAHTTVVPNGVDPSRFHPDVRPMVLPAANGRFVVGFSGSLKPWHGVEPLLQAFSMLVRQGEDCHLLVVGEGPMRQWIEEFVQGSGLTDRVTLTGWVSHDDLPQWLMCMDVAVAPYPEIADFYFSPLKIYEYLASGRPVVASAIGQIDGLIEDGVTGLLVRPGDVHGLTDAIKRLDRAPTLRRELGQAATRRAGEFTWQANARRVVEIAGAFRRAA